MIEQFSSFNFNALTDGEWAIYDWAFPSASEDTKHTLGFSQDPRRGRGLSTTQTVEEGSECCRLPWSRVLTYEKASKSLANLDDLGLGILPQGLPKALSTVINGASDVMGWSLVMTLFILCEMRLGENSNWRQWWKLLPVDKSITKMSSCVDGGSSDVSDFLIMERNEGVFNKLGDKILEDQVSGEMSWLRNCYRALFDLAPITTNAEGVSFQCPFSGCKKTSPPDLPTRLNLCPDHRTPIVGFDSFMWAFILVRSRAMEITCGDGVVRRVILPFIDMCNHGGPLGANVRLVGNREGVSLVALKDLPENDPVLLDYGERSMRNIARTFGFVDKEAEVEVESGGDEGGGFTTEYKLANEYRRARRNR